MSNLTLYRKTFPTIYNMPGSISIYIFTKTSIRKLPIHFKCKAICQREEILVDDMYGQITEVVAMPSRDYQCERRYTNIETYHAGRSM